MGQKALIIVDMQYDFLSPQGSLAVSGGDTVLPFVYSLLDGSSSDKYHIVVASLGYIAGHPKGHISFASTHGAKPFTTIYVPKPDCKDEMLLQMLWPDHCVQESRGSELEAGLKHRLEAIEQEKVFYIKKGTRQDVDSYSAFADIGYTSFTALSRVLHQGGVTDIDIVGVALDYCVRSTIIDARKFGFNVRLLRKGTKAVDAAREQEVLDELDTVWGVQIVDN